MRTKEPLFNKIDLGVEFILKKGIGSSSIVLPIIVNNNGVIMLFSFLKGSTLLVKSSKVNCIKDSFH